MRRLKRWTTPSAPSRTQLKNSNHCFAKSRSDDFCRSQDFNRRLLWKIQRLAVKVLGIPHVRRTTKITRTTTLEYREHSPRQDGNILRLDLTKEAVREKVLRLSGKNHLDQLFEDS